MNLYVYVVNNPWNWVDPLGLDKEKNGKDPWPWWPFWPPFIWPGGMGIPGIGFPGMPPTPGVGSIPMIGSIPDVGSFRGRGKNDIKQVKDVAKKHNIDPNDFGDYVEQSKQGEGRKPGDNYSYSELNDLAREFKNQI